jgi:hypothetical protein
MSNEEQTLRKGRFLREQVHKKLKESIINGILPPYKRLIEEKIAAEMEMSRTPVREAIQKLEKEGLIHKLPRGGYAISIVTIEDIDDVFGLRSVIEGYAAYLATQRATGADRFYHNNFLAEGFKDIYCACRSFRNASRIAPACHGSYKDALRLLDIPHPQTVSEKSSVIFRACGINNDDPYLFPFIYKIYGKFIDKGTLPCPGRTCYPYNMRFSCMGK